MPQLSLFRELRNTQVGGLYMSIIVKQIQLIDYSFLT